MKLRKKIIGVLTAAVYAVSFCAGAVTVGAKAAATLSISNEEGAPGETVYIYLNFEADRNLYVCDLGISYDGELYASRAESFNDFDVVSDVFEDDNAIAFAGYSQSDNGVSSGAFAQIPFTIPSDAVPGTIYNVTFSDVNEVDVAGGYDVTTDVAVINGSITVIEDTQPVETTPAVTTATLSISSEEGLPGETVYVYLNFEADRNLYSCDLGISYAGELYASMAEQCNSSFSVVSDVFKDDNVIAFAGYSHSDSGVSSGEFARIPFTIPSDAEPGTVYNITLEVDMVAAPEKDYNVKDVAVINGSITVIGDLETDVKYEDLRYDKIDEDDDGTYDYIIISGCDESATEVVIPDKIEGVPVTSIGYRAFGDHKSMESIEIPDSVISIESNAFSYCKNLTNVVIPNSVTSIGSSVFSGCTSLVSIEIPDSVILIREKAFLDCESLASIDIPDSVTSIESYAFCGCTNLESIEIPDSVTSIGDHAFYCCTGLTNIDISSNVTSMGGYEKGIDNLEYARVFDGCESLTNINVSDNNKVFSSLDGVLFNKDKTELLRCPEGKSGEYIIPEGVTGFSFSFDGCSKLTSIYIPSSLKESRITHNVEMICYDFPGCSSLTNIEVSEDNEIFASQDGVLFTKDKTGLICYPLGKIGEYTIPDGVEVTWRDSFSNCKLTSVEIPVSVKTIGFRTFDRCKNLESVIIKNPDCEIYGNADWGVQDIKQDRTICNGADNDGGNPYYNGTIFGYANSTAQKYAQNHDYKFESFGKNPSVTTPAVTTMVTTTTTTVLTTKTTTSTEATTAKTTSSEINTTVSKVTTGITTSTDKSTTETSTEKSTQQTTVSTTVTTAVTTTSNVHGDADGNGKTDIRDAAFIAKRVAQRKTDLLAEWTDYNNDGKLNILDAAAIARDVARRVL